MADRRHYESWAKRDELDPQNHYTEFLYSVVHQTFREVRENQQYFQALLD